MADKQASPNEGDLRFVSFRVGRDPLDRGFAGIVGPLPPGAAMASSQYSIHLNGHPGFDRELDLGINLLPVDLLPETLVLNPHMLAKPDRIAIQLLQLGDDRG